MALQKTVFVGRKGGFRTGTNAMYSGNIGYTLDRSATYSLRDRGLLNFQKASSLHVFSQAPSPFIVIARGRLLPFFPLGVKLMEDL